jgi:hypothetical protein
MLYDPVNYQNLDVQTDHMDAGELNVLLRHLGGTR